MTDYSLSNFLLDGSDRSVQDIVSKLKFIGKIEEGDIIDTVSLTLMKRGWSSSASRTVSSLFGKTDSRKIALEFFRQVIADGFEMATKYLARQDEIYQQLGNIILEALSESKKGLKNIAKTYEEDKFHTSQIETLIKTLDIKTTTILSSNDRPV